MDKEIYLDCTKLTRGSRWGKIMIPRLRQYCGSRFADFDRTMSDEVLFAFVYAKNTGNNFALETVRARATHDFVEWVNGAIAPDYMCSWLRIALRDRFHYAIQPCQLALSA